jgi:hypothetical protein
MPNGEDMPDLKHSLTPLRLIVYQAQIRIAIVIIFIDQEVVTIISV